MPWRHERAIDGFHEGTTLPRIRDYLVNDEGVRIELIGARGARVFRYRHGDLQFEFSAHSTTPPKEIDLDRSWCAPLGPECIVGLQGNAARIATFDQIAKASIAKNIVEALLAHGKLPTATPPHVEKVVFNNVAGKALDYQRC